jgi:phasin family protein
MKTLSTSGKPQRKWQRSLPSKRPTNSGASSAFRATTPECAAKLVQNLGAVLESTNAIASASEEFSREWMDTTRKVFEQTISRSENLAQCRTPQDFFAAQVELARESFSTLLHGTRRLSEISARTAQEATNKMSDRIRQAA